MMKLHVQHIIKQLKIYNVIQSQKKSQSKMNHCHFNLVMISQKNKKNIYVQLEYLLMILMLQSFLKQIINQQLINYIEKNEHTGSISPFIIKSKNAYGHTRKRSSITRQPINRSQPNASFTQKLTQIQTKYNPIKISEDMSRRTSVPPVPGRKLQLTLKPTNTQLKPKLNQQRLRK